MLSDRERETLQEIQRRFLVEDPDFAQSFEPDDQLAGRRSPRDRPPTPPTPPTPLTPPTPRDDLWQWAS